jgi:hypothetical protein
MGVQAGGDLKASGHSELPQALTEFDGVAWTEQYRAQLVAQYEATAGGRA